MVKVLGKIKKIEKMNTPMYMVRRKNRSNSLDCVTLHKFGRSLQVDCAGTCAILNDSDDNTDTKNKKNFSGKIYFHFPILSRV